MGKLNIYIVVILLSVFIPSFGALDKANTQWLVLSFLPLLFLKSPINLTFKRSKIFIIYSIFIIQAILSLIYTNNINISLIDLSRHLIIYILLITFLILLITEKISFYKISVIISIILIIETLLSLWPLFGFIKQNGFNFSIITAIDIDSLKGITGNRNITTASIAIKYPFLFYVLLNSKNISKYLFSVLTFLPALTLFLINSRAALLSFIFICALTLGAILIFHKQKFKRLILIILPILLSYRFANSIIPQNNLDTAQRISSINFTNEASSHRFFLWENAIDYIIKNPFFGCGIGNWKVESAAYWGSYGNKYLVPFHAHNDFLEFTTELGILGGVTYLILFLSMLYKASKNYLKSRDLKFIILFGSLVALFIDSSLNFPYERPIIQIMFLILLALNIHFDNSYETK